MALFKVIVNLRQRQTKIDQRRHQVIQSQQKCPPKKVATLKLCSLRCKFNPWTTQSRCTQSVHHQAALENWPSCWGRARYTPWNAVLSPSSGYPLVNLHITMLKITMLSSWENPRFRLGHGFNSYVSHNQRVYPINIPAPHRSSSERSSATKALKRCIITSLRMEKTPWENRELLWCCGWFSRPGKLTKSYGKSTIFYGKIHYKMVNFP